MKRTLTINISGIVFHIDEDAYDKLKHYLSNLNNHFSIEEGGSEIFADIESRVAELLQERIGSEQGVITITLVNEIIETMGMPEDIDDTEAEDSSSNNNRFQQEQNTANDAPYYAKHNKKLYRDGESRVLGGVCSGLAYYLNIDKILLRIIFVVLTIITQGAFALVYILFWIAVPKAKTISQRLKMKGQPINVDSIGKKVKEDRAQGKTTNENSITPPPVNESYYYEKRKKSDGRKILGKIFGVILLIIGLTSLIAITFSFFAATGILGIAPHFAPHFPNDFMIPHFINGGMLKLIFVAIILIIIVPLLLITYAGTRLLFNFTANNKAILYSALGVIIIGLIVAVSSGVGTFDSYRSNASFTETQEYTNPLPDTLYIEIDQQEIDKYEDLKFEFNNLKIMRHNGEEFLVGRPKFDVKKNNDGIVEIKQRKASKGRNYRVAYDNAQDIEYKYKIEGNTLFLSPYFFIEDEDKWRKQELKVTLEIPEGKVIYLDESILPIIYDIKNTTNTWDGDMVDSFWQMKTDGLTIVKNN